MSMTSWKLGAAGLLAGWLGLASPAMTTAADRTAPQILADIKAVEMPDVDKINRSDQTEVQKYIVAAQAALAKKADLVGELYKVDPNNAALVELLPERWKARSTQPTTDAEIDEVIAKTKSDELKASGSKIKVMIAFRKPEMRQNPEALLKVVEEYTAKYPKDDEGAAMLDGVAQRSRDEKLKADIAARIEKQYPDSSTAMQMAGERQRREAIGKPFAIEFVDAIKGTSVTSASLKGKVVVVDFWATWCGPCVAEMPKMKELYAKYKDQGVEFVGISLDRKKEQGGLDKLKKFVADNKIEWPQYYQGNYWQSEFSSKWGVNSIPCVFLVDAEGNLASTEARGKLETLIPEYLDKAKNTKAVANP